MVSIAIFFPTENCKLTEQGKKAVPFGFHRGKSFDPNSPQFLKEKLWFNYSVV